MERFESPEEITTFFNELTHWTSHDSRLKRPGITGPILFGSEKYSREELTAEMGSAFLCAMTGIDMPVIDNQTAYIAGWRRHISNGSADFLTGGGEE